jgi:hypothetical protein
VVDEAVLDRLQHWFRSRCDGDWEHGDGVHIETLDNPGWRVRINLRDTDLASRAFASVEVDRTDDDWLRLWVEGETWNAATGALNLTEALASFLAWAEA